ncbi:hypothetical protein GURASL_05440 [Geotalea uraniireducens]|uniref:Transposase n=1 Tax=Geotalea uraniireducens TaxID=351604 RepID=A0ABM8EGS5_9BACT|nr:hypothetical protein GURASL_05440 [Geotalea uraniireducens]
MIETDVATRFLAEVLEQAKRRKLLSKDHFSVDGTLIQAWASLKSFKPKGDDQDPPVGRNTGRDFKGEKLSNDTPMPQLPIPKRGCTARASTRNHGCPPPPIC